MGWSEAVLLPFPREKEAGAPLAGIWELWAPPATFGGGPAGLGHFWAVTCATSSQGWHAEVVPQAVPLPVP